MGNLGVIRNKDEEVKEKRNGDKRKRGVPRLWHNRAIALAQLCQHGGITVPKAWHCVYNAESANYLRMSAVRQLALFIRKGRYSYLYPAAFAILLGISVLSIFSPNS